MGDCQEFPNTWEEFEQWYGFEDKKEIYTNGSRLIQSFRVKQWLDHIAKSKRKKGKWIEVDFRDGEMYGFHKCSECCARYYCTFDTPPDWNYCPNCGAEMTRGE